MECWCVPVLCCKSRKESWCSVVQVPCGKENFSPFNDALNAKRFWNHVYTNDSFLEKRTIGYSRYYIVENWIDAEEEDEKGGDKSIDKDVPFDCFLINDFVFKFL